MAEALAGLGAAAAIAQFVTLSYRVVGRINHFQSKTKDAPAVFREISLQLPLMVDICQGIIKDELTTKPESFVEVVKACIQHVEALDSLISNVLPVDGDSKLVRTWKAVGSVRLEKKVVDYQKTLETYKTLLILQFSRTSNLSVRRLSETPTVPQNTCYYFPLPQISAFIGREDILRDLDEVLRLARPDAYRPNVAVVLGMGGQGKTSTVMEYCRRSQIKGHFNSILWIDATSMVSVAQSHASIADRIARRKRAFEDSNDCVTYVRETLEKWACPWLVVFDNYDQPGRFKNITDYYPRSSEGAIVFTSRNTDACRLGKTLRMPPMVEHEGVNLLLHRTQGSSSYNNVENALPIVQKLGCLPLAIDQAGAYISARRMSLSTFNEHYEIRKEKILRHTPDLWDYRKKLAHEDEEETSLNVFTTWEMSFQQISHEAEEQTSYVHFLTILAFFGNLDISEDMFKSYYKATKPTPTWLTIFVSGGSWDYHQYEDVVAQLSKLSLIQHVESEDTQCRVSLHPLIRDWIQLRLDSAGRKEYTLEAIKTLNSHIVYSEGQHGKWLLQRTREILSHLDTCCHNHAKFVSDHDLLGGTDLRSSMIAFAAFYTRHGRYGEAEDLMNRILVNDQKVFGAEHRVTFQTKLQMTDVYLCQGRYQEAETILLGVKPHLGNPGDPVSICILTNLAQAYFKEGRYSESTELYNKALDEQKVFLPSDHPDLLKSYEGLAQVYRNQGQHDRAIEFYNIALSGYEKLRGDHHPESLQILVYLASAYRNQARFQDSVLLYEKALVGHETYLGPDHPNTLVNMLNLAINYRNLSRFQEANKIFNTALSRSERILGAEHPDTLRVTMNLAMNYELSERLGEAESHYWVALHGREKKLGVEHPYTMRTVERLVSLLWTKRRLEEAEKLASRVLNAQKKDPWQGTTSSRTGDLTNSNGEGHYQAAEELFLRALARDEKTIATVHNDHVATLKSLLQVYIDRGQVDKAEEMETKLSVISTRLHRMTAADNKADG